MYHYSAERGVQMIISLLKKNNIRKIIASPGATNITMVASLQQDPFFEMFSCVDERAAAYMACGMAEESGESIVLSCTGATSSRNYMPALTEAYYRKLPILVITSSQDNSRLGHLIPQVTDRSNPPKDTVIKTVHLQAIKDENDEWDCNVKINSALIALRQHGGGPVHINLTTTYNEDYQTKELPETRSVSYYNSESALPEMPKKGRIAIFIGSHSKMSKSETQIIDAFCASHNAVAFCDHTSNYRGNYQVCNGILGFQKKCKFRILDVDLLIHIGGMSGSYFASDAINPKMVWRVSADGQLCDHYKNLVGLFEMDEFRFFRHYTYQGAKEKSFYTECIDTIVKAQTAVPELPFSNWWIAQNYGKKIPDNSVIHFGILNSLRSWNSFTINNNVNAYCNVGGFGIDGTISTLLGASKIHPNTIYFGIMGDLAFFYDLNSLGNRHISNNIRILLINNGCGIEFLNFNHQGARFGADSYKYIAAGGHFGAQSERLVKHLAEDLGFMYLTAKNKEEFDDHAKEFFSSNFTKKPIIFEVFTSPENESDAFERLCNSVVDPAYVAKKNIKSAIKGIIGESAANKILKTINKE